jgi:hypothetical protein
MRFQTTVVALTALLLAACGPIYETQYRYHPPADSEGRACASQCQTSKLQCRDTTELKADNSRLRCEADSRDQYERCLSTSNSEQSRNSCQRRSCSANPDYGICEADYRTCFAGCGGNVDAVQVCTFNCP